MSILSSLFYLVVVLAILIVVHELGHFIAAKLCGVRVEVFSIGFGPRLFGVRGPETDYRVSAVPLGGYVRMAGEMDAPAPGAQEDPRFFTAKPRWQRVGILCAGPTMNAILALVLWWGLFVHGTEVPDIPQGPPVVEQTDAGSPAERAGIQPGDEIVTIAGREIRSIEDYQEAIILKPGQTVVYHINRAGHPLDQEVTLGTRSPYDFGWDGVRLRIPLLIVDVTAGGPAEKAGIKPGDRILDIDGHVPGSLEAVKRLIDKANAQMTVTLLRGGREVPAKVQFPGGGGKHTLGITYTFARRFVQYGPVDAVRESLRLAGRNADLLYRTLSALARREVGLSVMSGPLEIARISKEQAAMGLIPFLQLLAFISLQLGIFNLLPIPMLDGGNILILLVESTLRRDVSMKIKERVLQVGFVLLVVFAVAVIAMDVRKEANRGTAAALPPAPEAPKP